MKTTHAAVTLLLARCFQSSTAPLPRQTLQAIMLEINPGAL